MGVLGNLFGMQSHIANPPQLNSIYPHQAAMKVLSGILPIIQEDKLILNKNEKCHFVDVATIVTEKKHYESKRVGGSYHIWKGFTMHTGRNRSDPVTEPEYTSGVLFFTSERVVFVARKYGFDMKLSKLTSITPYINAIHLQFGCKTFGLLLPDGEIANMTLNLIIK